MGIVLAGQRKNTEFSREEEGNVSLSSKAVSNERIAPAQRVGKQLNPKIANYGSALFPTNTSAHFCISTDPVLVRVSEKGFTPSELSICVGQVNCMGLLYTAVLPKLSWSEEMTF